MKTDKKKVKLQERIKELQTELRLSLTKKSSTTVEINVPAQQVKIRNLQLELEKLK